jgi:hypothetical protein
MNTRHTLITAIVAGFASGPALAATAIVYGLDSPSAEADILTGGEGSQTRSREVIHTDTQQFVIGQNFQLPGSETYAVTGVYLKSGSGEDWDIYSANLELKLFSGSGSPAGTVLLDEVSFDLAGQGNGTGTNDVLANEWVHFTLGTGVTMTGGQDYSFLLFFPASSGPNNDHKWAFRRDDSGIYADGNQWEGRHNATPAYDAADWPTNPWNNVLADGNDDFMFYVTGSVVPEPSVAALLLPVLGIGLLRRGR